MEGLGGKRLDMECAIEHRDQYTEFARLWNESEPDRNTLEYEHIRCALTKRLEVTDLRAPRVRTLYLPLSLACSSTFELTLWTLPMNHDAGLGKGIGLRLSRDFGLCFRRKPNLKHAA
jgi:hypothetical protein